MSIIILFFLISAFFLFCAINCWVEFEYETAVYTGVLFFVYLWVFVLILSFYLNERKLPGVGFMSF